jgi:hypothetical protein
MKFRFHQRGRRSERGYILLFLLLMVAILSIGFLEVAKYDLQYTVQQIKRDHEEELIHRGVQYSRAIRKFYKKFGRYPTRVEELESTNNYRCLRKRYKDPITGKDFKLLHLQDVQMSFGSTPNGTVPAAQLNQQAATAESADASDGAGTGASPGSAAGTQNVMTAQNSNSGDDASTVSQTTAAAATTPTGVMPQTQSLPQQLGANGQPQVFGGGGIVGVASLSKDKSIRVFCKLDHYNKWQFIYDPTFDRGGLLITPNQTCQKNLGFTQNQQNGQGAPAGQNPGGFGQNPGGLTAAPITPQQPQNSDQEH